jgi:hypothetical protein
MIVPHDASGGCTPIDKKESADSVSMASETISGIKTKMLGITFGKISLKIIVE